MRYQARGPRVTEGIRFAAGVASDPSDVVRLWKTVTGGKVVCCLPATRVPELLHAVGLLAIALASTEDLSRLSGEIDAWLVGEDSFPFPIPFASGPRLAFPRARAATLEDALDRVEALAEWAETVSGFPASEGVLWRSLRAYGTRRSLLDALDARCDREPSSFLAPHERRAIARAGIFLPPEAHSRLVSSILGTGYELPTVSAKGERGDPLLVLARRLM